MLVLPPIGPTMQAVGTQTDQAKKLGRIHSYVADVERGERRVDIIEYTVLAEKIGFDALAVIRAVMIVN